MSVDNAYAVELKGLTFRRGARTIFDKVDIRIPRGKVTGIMGPSGCGKTTLLRLIAAQLRPHAGEVWVNQCNLPQLSRSELFHMRKQFGVLFQSGALFCLCFALGFQLFFAVAVGMVFGLALLQVSLYSVQSIVLLGQRSLE